ncbi:MAG: amidohydrolase family protein [Armatimonadota bacterium]
MTYLSPSGRDIATPLPFFDCNARIGKWVNPRPTEFTDRESLLREMDNCGIGEALVYHATAREFSPAAGNEELMCELAGEDRLHPCWVLLPHATAEFPEPEVLVPEMIARGARAARLWPKHHQFVMNEATCGRLFSALEEHKVPLILDMGQTDWRELERIMRRHPAMPVIVLETFYRVDRYTYPLFESHENFYLETATYEVFGGIEAICERFGPERLVFGTGMPVRDPGGAVSPIIYADMDDEARRLVAGDNLRRLLGEVC